MTPDRLTHAALLALGLACHARTAADARQEEQAARAADEAEHEGESATGRGSDEGHAGAHDQGSAPAERSGAGDQASISNAGGAAGGGAAHGGGKTGQGQAGKDEKRGEQAAAEDIDVATSPQGLLQPGAMDKVREKLGLSRGDTSTSAALRRFQREHDLPATGMLDHETVAKLGLAPDEIFEK